MAVKTRIGSSFPSVSVAISPTPFHPKVKLKMISSIRLSSSTEHSRKIRVVKSCQLIHRKLVVNEISSKKWILFATSEGQEPQRDAELDDFEQEQLSSSVEDNTSTAISYHHTDGGQGKPGFISFYGRAKGKENKIPDLGKDQKHFLSFLGPAILVASFVFPLLHLRKILCMIFEDSLLTDFLIMFLTEAVFYSGVAVYLFLIDRQRRSMGLTAVTNQNLSPRLGDRISTGAVLVLSLIVPMMTMGLVWPWIGPVASATLAPYLVGNVVQFAFEQYARHISSPSLPAIPIIFQVYRLHQLNRAAQLATSLSFTILGAEKTPHNVAVQGSLRTLLNVLHFLAVISIWSLSSFVMRCFPSTVAPEQ